VFLGEAHPNPRLREIAAEKAVLELLAAVLPGIEFEVRTSHTECGLMVWTREYRKGARAEPIIAGRDLKLWAAEMLPKTPSSESQSGVGKGARIYELANRNVSDMFHLRGTKGRQFESPSLVQPPFGVERMTDDRKFDEAFGLDMPMDEALQRFSRVTREELQATGSDGETIPEGSLETVSFQKATIRRVLHSGEWWYSIVDFVGAIVGTDRASKYWNDLKTKLTDDEGFFELSDYIGKLPMTAADGKTRPAEVATTETLFRIIQSVNSPKADPIKRWLARVGYERIQEWQDPEIGIKRAIATYQVQGRTDDWIEKRIRSIVVRKELTSEWRRRGVQEGKEYAMLTNTISQETFGTHTEGHKRIKGLAKQHNLRDHMNDLELILTMLGETSTKEIAKQRDAQGFYPNHRAAKAGGEIAGSARKQIETQTGRKVVTPTNFLGRSKRTADPENLTAAKMERR
jgi:DNA-damage-inducible protein D